MDDPMGYACGGTLVQLQSVEVSKAAGNLMFWARGLLHRDRCGHARPPELTCLLVSFAARLTSSIGVTDSEPDAIDDRRCERVSLRDSHACAVVVR
jgi:hypothetical protein